MLIPIVNERVTFPQKRRASMSQSNQGKPAHLPKESAHQGHLCINPVIACAHIRLTTVLFQNMFSHNFFSKEAKATGLKNQ